MKNIFTIACLLFATVLSHGQNVVQVEYFLDTDLGYGNNTVLNLSPAADGTFPFTVKLTNATAGNHLLYIRTKDSDGRWSITSRKNIEVGPAAAPRITGGEYFFDTDPGFNAGNAITITPQDSAILQNFPATTAGLSVGYHQLYTRLRDVYGKWGLTSRRNLEVVNIPTSIKGVEYFFVTDAGVGSSDTATIKASPADSTFSFNIPLQNIPTGANTLHIRVRDSVSKSWSLTAWQADSVITSVQSASGLWSDTLTWSNHKIPTVSTVVILHNNVTVDIDAFCKSLTPYRNDVHVIVNQGKKLSIVGH